MVGEDIDGIGIGHQWALGTPQLGYDGNGRLLARAQSRTNADSLEVFGVDGLGEGCLLTVELQHCLRHADLHDEVVALRGMGGDAPCSHPQAGLGGQDGSPAHAITARNDEGIAHLAFVGKGVARQ